MAEFTAADVKRLRDATGAGMMDCKKALTEADGDYDKAVEFLRVKGAKDVGKRLERSTTNGIVVSKDGALLELDCETDFVAKNADFVKLAERLLDIALDKKPADAEALLATEVDGQTVAALVEGEFGADSAAPLESGEAPAGFEIKGNKTSKKFHAPSSPWYDRTNAEVWFRTSEAAEAAGFVNAESKTDASA